MSTSTPKLTDEIGLVSDQMEQDNDDEDSGDNEGSEDNNIPKYVSGCNLDLGLAWRSLATAKKKIPQWALPFDLKGIHNKSRKPEDPMIAVVKDNSTMKIHELTRVP